MTPVGPEARPARGAWPIVFLGFTALALTFSGRALLSLIVPELEQEFGWTRGFIANTGALALVVMAIVAPLAGRLIDIRGLRVTLITGLALIAVGSALLTVTDNPWVFVFCFGLVCGAGFGFVATHVVATAVAHAFVRNTGVPTGIATSGATAGQFFILPLLAAIMTALTWRWSFGGLALASLALIPFAWFLTAGLVAPDRRSDGGPSSIGSDLRFLVTSRAFHILFWSFFICGYTTSGVIENHFLPYASFCGFAPLVGASAYGVLSVVNFAGMITSGWLTDRMNRPLLLGTIYILRALTFLILINVGTDVEILFAFAIAFGVVDFATIPVTASLAVSHLGLRVMGLAMGLIVGGHQFGGALGAFLGGYLFDLYAHYEWLWLSSIAVAAAGGLLVYTMRDHPATPRLAAA